MNIPKTSAKKEEILKKLEELSRDDLNPTSGRLFAHAYETGLKELYYIVREAYLKYLNKTMLNFTVYPSILKLENQIVSMTASLLNGDENVVGNFTYGGTESIFIAMKAARDFFFKRKGKNKTPEVILPSTGHPAFYKSAHLLGLKLKVVSVDPSTFKVDIDEVNEEITDRTAMIVGSAPNYPYGTVDDIKGLGELSLDHDTWLHVDACIGGFVLPFFKKLGVVIPKFDFEVEGVTSLSVDLHKYGYAPKGASVILYRSKEYRLYQLYINASWPGYPLVNTTLLSSRSSGPLAASWAVLNYLGEEGYLRLARKILNAKNKLLKGLKDQGFRILGNPESSIIAFTSDNINVFLLADYMRHRGWYIQVQPGSKYLGFPPSIHLTISPIHDKLAEGFLKDLEESVKLVEKVGEPLVKKFIKLLGIGIKSPEELSKDVPSIMEALGISGKTVSGDMALINMLIRELPPDIVEYLFGLIINELFIHRG